MVIPANIPIPAFEPQKLFLTNDATHKVDFVSMSEIKQYAKIVFTFPFKSSESYSVLQAFGSEKALNIYLKKRIMQYIDSYWPFKGGLQSEAQFNIMTDMASGFLQRCGIFVKLYSL